MQEQIVPPSPWQIDNGIVQKYEGDRGGAQYKIRPSKGFWPLDFYLDCRLITKKQRRAGNRYYALWMASSHAHHHVQSRYQEFATAAGNPADRFSAKFIMALEYRDAMLAIEGVLPKYFVRLVCCDGTKAGRGNMEYLKSGLDDLIRHFKYN